MMPVPLGGLVTVWRVKGCIDFAVLLCFNSWCLLAVTDWLVRFGSVAALVSVLTKTYSVIAAVSQRFSYWSLPMLWIETGAVMAAATLKLTRGQLCSLFPSCWDEWTRLGFLGKCDGLDIYGFWIAKNWRHCGFSFEIMGAWWSMAASLT